MMRTRRNRLALGAFLALSMLASACSCDGADTGESEGIVQLVDVTFDDKVGNYVIDFGNVAIDTKRTVAVIFKNVGSNVLAVERASLQAPFSSDMKSEGLEIAPGETAEVKFTFSPTPEDEGENQLLVKVPTSNDEIGIHFHGTGVVPEFYCSPQEVMFGKVELDDKAIQDVVCENKTPIDLKIRLGEMRGDDVNSFRILTQTENGLVTVPRNGRTSIPIEFTATSIGEGKNARFEILQEDETPIQRTRLHADVIASALVVDDVLDFGFAQPNQEPVWRELQLTNEGSKALNVNQMVVEPEGVFTVVDPDKSIIPPDDPTTPERENIVNVTMEFAPREQGNHTATLTILSSAKDTEKMVQLVGLGGGPVISCTPEMLDFGQVVVGVGRTMYLSCVNAAEEAPDTNADNLVVEEVVSGSPEFKARLLGTQPLDGFPPGASFQVEIKYDPTDPAGGGDAEQDSSMVSIVSNDTARSPLEVSVTGLSRKLPDCDYTIRPSKLAFGIVDKDKSARLEFAIVNNAAHECLVNDVRLDPASHAAFQLEEPVGFASIPGYGELRVPVIFAPTAYANVALTGKVLFTISNKLTPDNEVEISGWAQKPCAVISPETLDFGTVKPGCSTRDRYLTIVNVCDAELTLSNDQTITIEQGASDGEFVVVRAPPEGTVLKRGEMIEFELRYAPQNEGRDLGAVMVWVEGMDVPYMASLQGNGSNDAIQVDTFEQNERPKVDVLWVIDNSCSMSPFQQRIAENLPAFLSFALAQQIDFQIGVTTTGLTTSGGCPGGVNGGEDGRLFPVDNSYPRILRPNTPNLEEAYANNVNVGDCHGTEPGLEAAYRALTPPLIDNADDPRHPEPNDGNLGFLRPDAHLSLIFLQDEVDQSPQTPAWYYNEFQKLKGWRNTNLFTAHAIVGPKGTGCSGAAAGDRYLAVVEASGGVTESICTGDWEESLEKIGGAAFAFKTRFTLTSLPEDTNQDGFISDLDGEIMLKIDGRSVGSFSSKGARVWEYNEAANAIDFFPLFVPEPGAKLEVTYKVACL